MVAASEERVAGSGHILLNAGGDVPERMTAIVVGASTTAAAGVVAVLRQAGLFATGAGARSAHLVEHPSSATIASSLRRCPAPRLIVVSHDPVDLIEELGTTGDPTVGVRRAKDRIDLIFKVALKSTCPVLVLSHGLVIGPLARLAAVLGPFCGFDSPSSEEPGPGTPTRAVAMPGIVALRVGVDGSRDGAPRTIVIGGPPRSGTSLIAAVLHASGLPLGNPLVSSTFENTMHNILFKTSSPRTWKSTWKSVLEGSWKAAVADPRHFRLAWDGFDVAGLEALIAQRRRDGPVWGLKRPGIGSFLRLGGLRLLEGPRLIMSARDPVDIAARISRAHDVEAKVALRIASWFLLDTLETARRCDAPTLLVSHEMARRDLPGLFGRLTAFCGLEVDPARYDDIVASVEQAGDSYRKDFAAPFVGEIMDVVGHDVFGWVEAGQRQPVVVQLLADDRPIASGVADELTADGLLSFTIRLSPDEVTSATRIRAVLPQSQAELRNSGLTLAELRLKAAVAQ